MARCNKDWCFLCAFFAILSWWSTLGRVLLPFFGRLSFRICFICCLILHVFNQVDVNFSEASEPWLQETLFFFFGLWSKACVKSGVARSKCLS